MRLSWIALSVALATVTVAQPHRHQHRHGQHIEKRSPETKVVYMLGDKEVSEAYVKQGLADGSLVIVDNQVKSAPVSSAEVAASTPEAKKEEYSWEHKKENYSWDHEGEQKDDSQPAPEDKKKDEQPKPDEKSAEASPSGGEGVDRDFPDGELDCSQFPSEYGAIALDHLNLGGWTGLQKLTYSADGSQVDDIMTAIKGPCEDGMMCSYACPTGYQKAQWPKEQGSKGQSVGGIACKNGKLHLPGGGISQKLCIPGVGGVKVKNTLGKKVPICRTEYPGTESMVIPATLEPASSEPYELTCPDGDTYWRNGKDKTTAQYYVNPSGTSIEDGCKWGEGGDTGNWAPMILGVGSINGVHLSLFQNEPTNANDKLDFNVKIVGDDLSCECKFENGVYLQNGKDNIDGKKLNGCTVKVNSGEATYVFY